MDRVSNFLDSMVDGILFPFVAVYRFQRYLDQLGDKIAAWLLKD